MRGRIGSGLALFAGTVSALLLLAGCGGGGGGGTAGNTNAAVLLSDVAAGDIYSFSASNNSFSSTILRPLGGASYYYSSGPSWVQITGTEYFLNTTGNWQNIDSAAIVDNGDGSVSFGGVAKYAISSVTDLTGQSPSCIDSNGASFTCPSTQTYAAGARRFSGSQTVVIDWYALYTQVTKVTDLSGVETTTLPAAGAAGYCIQTQNAGIYLYQQNGATYDRFSSFDCAAGSIATALGGTAIEIGLTITTVAPHGVTLLQISSLSLSRILGQVTAGTFMTGTYYPQNTSFGSRDFYNRSAIDTLTTAQGLPALP